MPTASEILSAIAPRFDADANRAMFLQMAESRTSSTYYGENRSEAVALRAAHMLTVSEGANASGGSTTGPVSAKSEGDLSVSYGKVGSGSSDSASNLATTDFGRELLDLRKGSGTGVRVTGVPFVFGTY